MIPHQKVELALFLLEKGYLTAEQAREVLDFKVVDKVLTENPHYCDIHKRPKVWMISSSFCPACDQAQPTSEPTETYSVMGTYSYDPYAPGGYIISNKSPIQLAWEAKYGQFVSLQRIGPAHYTVETYPPTVPSLPAVTCTNLHNAGYPLYQAFSEWHGSIAIVWPV